MRITAALLLLVAFPAAAEVFVGPGSPGFTQFGWRSEVTTADPEGEGTPYDRDLQGVRDAICIALGGVRVCSAGDVAEGQQGCVAVGDLVPQPRRCTAAWRRVGACTQQELDDEATVTPSCAQTWDYYQWQRFRQDIKQGRDAYERAVSTRDNAAGSETRDPATGQ